MQVLKQGVPSQPSIITGSCDKCGCIAHFSTKEAFRNASREDHKDYYATNYYVSCVTEGCNGKISGYEEPK